MVALLVGLSVVVAVPGVGLAGEKPAKSPDDAVREGLGKKITLNFPETAFGEGLIFIQDITGINVVVDPAVDATQAISLRLKDITVQNALELMVEQVGDCTYEVWRGTLFFTSKKSPKPAPPPPALTDDAKKIAEEKRLTLNFPETPLEDVVAFLQDITGVNFVLGKGLEERTVSFRVKDVTVGAALDIICRVAGLEIERAGDANVFKARE